MSNGISFPFQMSLQVLSLYPFHASFLFSFLRSDDQVQARLLISSFHFQPPFVVKELPVPFKVFEIDRFLIIEATFLFASIFT